MDADGEWRVIWPEAVEALRVHKARRMAEVAASGVEWSEDQMVFLTKKGDAVNAGSWWKHFQLLTRKLGMPRVKPHPFRHIASTTDNRAGVDPNTRMLQRGRVSMESERAVYIHPELRDQHVAAEASHRVFFERRSGACLAGNLSAVEVVARDDRKALDGEPLGSDWASSSLRASPRDRPPFPV